LTLQQITAGIIRLQKRIEELESFEPATVGRRGSPEVYALSTSIDETLERVFGRDTIEYERYELAGRLDDGQSFGGDTPLERVRQYLLEDKERGLALLRQAVRGLEEEASAQRTKVIDSGKATATTPQSRKIFIVHGHAGAEEAVALFLTRLGFDPVILHRQPNQGRTIIEKFEAHSDVGFAVALLTPDDRGGPNGGEQRPRAQQNVILELGYFIGRLTRARVCALKTDDVELPSDILGLVWEEFDAHGAWELKLAKELRAAEYDIDLNKVM
jgi:predicted nucleotide-binding protein